MKKCLIVFGTRPEAIKFAPIISEMEKCSDTMRALVCVTGQHREMLDDVLDLFDIIPNYDLDIMRPNQALTDITCRVLRGLEAIIDQEKPDILLVQGDTTSSFAASLAAYYHKVPVGHVEAGLRSWDKYHPYPEEMNRRITDALTDLYFAPTSNARENLLKEGISEECIIVTGNTVIDALLAASNMPYEFDIPELAKTDGSIILVTAHRRESFGSGLSSICQAIKKLAKHFPDITFVYPVHKNPKVVEIAFSILNDQKNVLLIAPLPYLPFVHLMKRSIMILSDSGGIQEEAPSLNKPLLVLRDVTERPEVIEVGAARLVGTDPERIFRAAIRILENENVYQSMAEAKNPFGDGNAAERIVSSIHSWLMKIPSC
ncbi:MAG: UDP-N-acetylglucosamine 2-epimerase (non-hydrolyzing) [Deltaproteobacteria bacterium]|nr:UDP-N-acetylglucosamine 2-epimerase (non-hydrolyzing) [Deltaproteobacteria bacterium]